MSFNTGNPVPSADAKDLSDNAENFDSAVNAQADTWTDRLAVTRDTVNGRIKKMGYTVPITYAGGELFTVNDNVKTVDEGGIVYAPLPSALPFITSGTFVGDDDARFFVVQGFSELEDVAAMKTTNLLAGQVVSTKRFYAGENKGGAAYLILPIPAVADGFGDHALVNGNVASLQHNGVVNAYQLGVKGGVAENDTLNIQGALDYHSAKAKLIFSPDVYMVDGDYVLPTNTVKFGVHLPDNTNIEGYGAIIRLIPTNSQQYNVLIGNNVNNITIKGLFLDGDRDTHPAANPELGNAIGLRLDGVNNAFIHDLIATKMWTDGIAVVYDTKVATYLECQNVHLINCSGGGNIRNGASIIGCKKGSIRGGNYSNNNGTNPQAGIDVEPNTLKPNAQPAIVSEFEITGVIADSNAGAGILADARGDISWLNMHHNICRFNKQGIVALNIKQSKVRDNIVISNTEVDITTNCDGSNDIGDNLTSIPPVSTTDAINTNQQSQAVVLTANGGTRGLEVQSDDQINVGIKDFSFFLRMSEDEWPPLTERSLISKYDFAGTTGWTFSIHPLGRFDLEFRRNDGGTTYSVQSGVCYDANSVQTIGTSIQRETAIADGLMIVFVNGEKVGEVVIPMQATYDLSTTTPLNIGGYPFGGQWNSTFQAVYLFNSYLINVEGSPQHMELYRNGLTEAQKWGTQAPSVSGCVLALEPEGIQPAPGLWLDSSTNKNNARHPTADSSLRRYKKDFEVRWSNEWVATNEVQYLGDTNSPILPVGNIRIESISSISTAGAVNVEYGDGASIDRFVSAAALSSGFTDFTIASRNTDLANRDFTVKPSASFTGTIRTIVKGSILD